MITIIFCKWPGHALRKPFYGQAFAALLAALGVTGMALAGEAQAQAASPPSCPVHSIRWQDDCSTLRGRELQGVQRLRYRALTADDAVWLTLGGEARVRMDLLRDIDFGISRQPGYVSTSGRLLANADLRSRAGPRAFVQLGLVEENGRKPGARAQDESQADVTQAFIDTPFKIGRARLSARIGRQELELSGNRLVTTRDGATLRRAFEGATLEIAAGGTRIVLVSVHPMRLENDAFADRAERTETFHVVSIDLPPALSAGGSLNLFLLDRDRQGARYLRAQGAERRSTIGAHYARKVAAWRIDAQGAWQMGQVAGKPVRAYGAALQLDRDLGGPSGAAVGFDVVIASGDKASTRAIETFDPVYPNNGGLSDAPLFFQTNYVFAGGSVSARWARTTWTAGANLLARHSVDDAVYANGRPIAAAFGGQPLSSLLSQVSARRAVGSSLEVYASLVHAAALGGVRGVGGRDAMYSRVQLTARF